MIDKAAIGKEFQEKVNKLRTFLHRPTHQGGVFLVIGQRGTGKTRLVEEGVIKSDAGIELPVDFC